MANYAVFPNAYTGSIDGVTTHYKAGDVKQIIDQDGDVIYFDAVTGVNKRSAGVLIYDNEFAALEMSESILDKIKGIKVSGSYTRPTASIPVPPTPEYRREYPVGQRLTFDLGHVKLIYTVDHNYLSEQYGDNSRIFRELKEDKIDYAKAVYGYYDGGEFPTSREASDLDEMIQCLFCDAEDAKDNWEESLNESKREAVREIERKQAEAHLKRMALKGKEIIFTLNDRRYTYRITETYLENREGPNDELLKNLFGDKSSAISFIGRVYGYHPVGGTERSGFPEWRPDDWNACERIVAALKEKCSQDSLAWRLAQTMGTKVTVSLSEADIYREAMPKWVSAPTKTPVFTGTSEFSKKIDDVSFDGLDVEELSINS